MSTGIRSAGVRSPVVGLASAVRSVRGMRGLALAAVAVLILSFTSVLYGIVDVVGDPATFAGVVAATVVLATVLSPVLSVRTGLAIGGVLLVAGLGVYLLALPVDIIAQRARIVSDVFAMLTGLSVLRIQRINVWVLSITPAPVFLAWYFALRRAYVGAVAVGGGTLGFFVLTGDVGTTVTLFGVLAVVSAVAFGRLERVGGDHTGVETLAVVLAAIVLLTSLVSVVPGGQAQPFRPLGGDDRNLEGSLVEADESVSIQGSISLTPKVRFTVESTDRAYWRAGAYDRFTGQEWIRTGSTSGVPDFVAGPPGRARTITQQYRAESSIGTMPAAWKPTDVSGGTAGLARMTDLEGLQPADTLVAGDTYQVSSRKPVATRADLRNAGTDYPERIRERYTQLPASTPDRVAERTDRITANADNPYDTAQVIEQWLENNREYSLNVDRPDGNIADAFLFEMERGYCTYYATTMVTMLRSQNVPARFVVGYTPGQQVDDSRWVVRGLDSHAWVEVYFPEVGWVRFDPTPSAQRRTVERQRLAAAREENASNIDTEETNDQSGPGSVGDELTTPPIERPNGSFNGSGDAPIDSLLGNRSEELREPGLGSIEPGNATEEGEGDDGPFQQPSREQVGLGLVVAAGVAAGVRRTGAHQGAYRLVWLRWQPRRDPVSDAERAFDRVEFVLERRYREREPGETRRRFLAAVDADGRARRVLERYERARYAGELSEGEADEAVELADEFVDQFARLRA